MTEPPERPPGPPPDPDLPGQEGTPHDEPSGAETSSEAAPDPDGAPPGAPTDRALHAGPDGPVTAPDGGPYNPPPPDRPDTSTAPALAGLVRAVRGRVEQLETGHAHLREAVEQELGPTVTELRRQTFEQLAVHTAQIKNLFALAESQNHPPIDWPALSADEAREQWPILAQWIGEVLVPWYEITREDLPDCWALHRPAVVELSWLRVAYAQAHIPSAAAGASADWHTRWLPAVLSRVRTVIGRTRRCRPGEHDISQAESRARRGEPTPGAPAERTILPTEQLATPEFWWSFYTEAVHTDLAARTGQSGPPDPPA